MHGIVGLMNHVVGLLSDISNAVLVQFFTVIVPANSGGAQGDWPIAYSSGTWPTGSLVGGYKTWYSANFSYTTAFVSAATWTSGGLLASSGSECPVHILGVGY